MDEQFKEFSAKLDILIRLTALSLVSGKKQQEQFFLLNTAGFQPKDIAELLDTTPNNVRVGLSPMRTKKRKEK